MGKQKTPNVIAWDLFCGAGGLTWGLHTAGINVRFGVDNDPACRIPYQLNSGARLVQKNVSEIRGEDFKTFKTDRNFFTALVGCPPCQTFSSLNSKTRGVKDAPNDPRWRLVLEFARLVEEFKPDFVALENVPGLQTKDVFKEFLGRLKLCGYQTAAQVVDAASYGVPQRRKRLILLASRRGEIRLLTPSELGATQKTVRDAIGDLEPLEAGEASTRDPLHRAGRLSELNLRRIRAIKPGENRRRLPDVLKLDCQRKPGGDRYATAYTRLEWDKVAPTVTTEFYILGTGRNGHPEQDRALTLREGARLQTFPDDYLFTSACERVNVQQTARLIGNAVPPLLGAAIGKSILESARQCTTKTTKN